MSEVRERLDALFSAYDAGGASAAKKILQAAKKDPGLSQALAPLLQLIKEDGGTKELALQLGLEQPSGTPIHEAARAAWSVAKPAMLVARATGQPKRSFVDALALSRDGKHVYAGDEKGVVSVWSAETGAHLEDRKVTRHRIDFVEELADGRLRVVSSEQGSTGSCASRARP